MASLTKGLITVLGAAITIGVMGAAKASIVAPNASDTVEGSINNSFPFDVGNSFFEEELDLTIDSMRYQQVYNASEFEFSTQPFLITKIRFRPDAEFGQAFSSTLLDVQINLSTTSAAADMLSTVFDENIGVDETVVFDRGALSLSSAAIATPFGTQEFDIEIDLDIPFLYNPSAGNLLLDVRNFAGGVTTPLDAVFEEGDATSRVFSGFFEGDVDSSTGFADTVGLVTQFVTEAPEEPSAVPEPTSVVTLFAMGAGLAGIALKRR